MSKGRKRKMSKGKVFALIACLILSGVIVLLCMQLFGKDKVKPSTWFPIKVERPNDSDVGGIGDENKGGNTDDENKGGNTDDENKGGNTDDENKGGNTDDENKGGNTDDENKGNETPKPHEHEFSTEWTQGANEHYHSCKGCEATLDNAAHSYEDGACTVCGKEELHEHDFATEWTQGANEHYHACSGCTETLDNAAHSYEDGTCTVCGKSAPHVHDFSTAWTQGANEHYHVCNGCAETRDNALHSYSNGVCTVCGRNEPHVHNFSTEWTQGETEHYHACSGCTETRGNAEHSYSSGVCTVCGKTFNGWNGEYSPQGMPLNCECIDRETGECLKNCNCEEQGGCDKECPCNCLTDGLPCGCACEGCECYYGYTCISDADSCNCTCHNKASITEDEFLPSSYLYGEEFGYDLDSGEFKVAFNFPSPAIRDCFDVSVTFGNGYDYSNNDGDDNVYFSIKPKANSLFELSGFYVQACKGGIVENIVGTVTKGSFRIRGNNYDYCMQKDEHYFIVRVYVAYTYDLYSDVSYVGAQSEDYEPVIQLKEFLKTDEMKLFIHSGFEYLIKKITFNDTVYEFDEDNPFGGYYTFPIYNGLTDADELYFVIEFEEEFDAETGESNLDGLLFGGYESIDNVAAEIPEINLYGIEVYRIYRTSDGRIKVDICYRAGMLSMRLWNTELEKEFSVKEGLEIGLIYNVFEYGGYVAFWDEYGSLQVQLSHNQ